MNLIFQTKIAIFYKILLKFHLLLDLLAGTLHWCGDCSASTIGNSLLLLPNLASSQPANKRSLANLAHINHAINLNMYCVFYQRMIACGL